MSISDLHVVCVTLVPGVPRDVQGGYVQYDLLPVGGGDTPLTLLLFVGGRGVGELAQRVL